MHKSSLLRMNWFVENYVAKIQMDTIRILEIGSCDVNGSYKNLFAGSQFVYQGLDVEAGPNVDIVPKKAYRWEEIENESFDIIISGQAFEHIEFFWVTMAEMARVLKKDGLICVIAPKGFKEHRYPVDCYRFFSDGMVALARYVGMEPLHAHTNAAPLANSKGWYSKKYSESMLVAKKPYHGNTVFADLNAYNCIPPDQEMLLTGFIPYESRKKYTYEYFLTMFR